MFPVKVRDRALSGWRRVVLSSLGADNRSRHVRIVKQPGQCHISGPLTQITAQFFVGFELSGMISEPFGKRVAPPALHTGERTTQQTTIQRAIGAEARVRSDGKPG